jgi:hypothetical protein
MEGARAILSAILHRDLNNINAWRWMAAAIDDPAKKRQCWQRVLSLKPGDAQAMQALGLQTSGVGHPQQAMSQATGETVYLDDGNVIVTNTRVVIGGKTYTAKHITSVQMVKKQDETRIWGILMAVVGGLLSLSGLLLLIGLLRSFSVEIFGIGGICLAAGIVILLFGILLTIVSRDKFIIRLASASGEVDALTSTKREEIAVVVEAVTKMITG